MNSENNLNNIKNHRPFIYFFSRLDYLLSRSFLCLLSRFSDNIIDFIRSSVNIKEASLVKNLKFKLTKEKINNLLDWADEYGERIPRGTVNKKYSSSIKIDPNNKLIYDLVIKGSREISLNYGKNLWVNALLYDIESIPSEYYSVDTYSNIWHQDSHDGYLVFKMFVLMQDVSEKDGPFIYLDRENTIKYWRLARDRNSDAFNSIHPLKGLSKSFTGSRGDIMMINTATCFHRDSVPNSSRKILCITYFPEWRKHSDCIKIKRDYINQNKK